MKTDTAHNAHLARMRCTPYVCTRNFANQIKREPENGSVRRCCFFFRSLILFRQNATVWRNCVYKSNVLTAVVLLIIDFSNMRERSKKKKDQNIPYKNKFSFMMSASRTKLNDVHRIFGEKMR